MYASEGLPWRSKRTEIGLLSRNGQTYLFHRLSYKVARLNGLKRKKMARYNQELLQAYRHYIEAGKVSQIPLQQEESKKQEAYYLDT